MTFLTTIIVLSLFYGAGTIACFASDTGHCGDRDQTEISQEK